MCWMSSSQNPVVRYSTSTLLQSQARAFVKVSIIRGKGLSIIERTGHGPGSTFTSSAFIRYDSVEVLCVFSSLICFSFLKLN